MQRRDSVQGERVYMETLQRGDGRRPHQMLPGHTSGGAQCFDTHDRRRVYLSNEASQVQESALVGSFVERSSVRPGV